MRETQIDQKAVVYSKSCSLQSVGGYQATRIRKVSLVIIFQIMLTASNNYDLNSNVRCLR